MQIPIILANHFTRVEFVVTKHQDTIMGSLRVKDAKDSFDGVFKNKLNTGMVFSIHVQCNAMSGLLHSTNYYMMPYSVSVLII